jgi:chromosome segregation ATPase
VKETTAAAKEAKLRAEKAIVDGSLAFSKGCNEAIKVQQENTKLHLEVAELSKACAERMSDIAEMETKLKSVQSDLAAEARKLETAITLNEVQYQRGQAGFEEHVERADQFRVQAEKYAEDLIQLQKVLNRIISSLCNVYITILEHNWFFYVVNYRNMKSSWIQIKNSVRRWLI